MLEGFRSRWTTPRSWRAAERRERGERQPSRLPERQRPALEAAAQRLALEQLHDQERTLLVLADVEELADVRMDDGGSHPRLAAQPLGRGRVNRPGQALDGHPAPQHLVDRCVDHAHAADAELRVDPVTTLHYETGPR